jgi:Sulfotransferase family
MAGSAASLSRIGWRFEALLEGPHRCPSCAYRGNRDSRRRLSPPRERPALPNVLVIGATKAATTAVHSYLALHPEIDMATDKELNFFLDPDCLERLDEYATFFDARFRFRGEASPLYTYAPNVPGVPPRVRAAIPDAKLIYLVRDPVERALSDYAHYAALWGPRADAFAHPEHPYNVYTAPSMYARQLETYLAEFPREQILVVDQADLLADGNATMRAIFRFLGADEDFRSPRFEDRVNPAESRRRMTRLGRWLRGSGLATALGRLPAGPRDLVLATARRVMFRPPSASPQPSAELRHRLRATFADDAARLRELTGLDFASWQI